jgi:F-type H+-transporting ATPase subunit c
MRKAVMIFSLMVFVVAVAPVSFAAEGDTTRVVVGVNWIAISAAFGMALAAAFCGIAQSRVAAAACEGMARNPGAADAIRAAMILGLVFIETLVLFTFGMIYLKAI